MYTLYKVVQEYYILHFFFFGENSQLFQAIMMLWKVKIAEFKSVKNFITELSRFFLFFLLKFHNNR